MASSFDRWEKDPFFSAAEEIQESADRMESTYRTWMHAKKDASSMWNCEELRRDLRTALGTTKWQLEEFQRAVGMSYVKTSGQESRDRHREFISAIEDHISRIEGSLQESAQSEGKNSLPWVLLDEGECNELALFLSGSSASADNATLKNHRSDDVNQEVAGKDLTADILKSSDDSVGWGSKETSNEKSYGHRRSASANADIGALKIAVSEVGCQPDSSNGQPLRAPRKIPSFSGLSSSTDYASKMKWPKNVIRKWKAMDINQETDAVALRSTQLTKGIHACYEKSKSCLNGCDECCDKQIYGWYGVIQRQLQRSQYQMQYSRPVQLVIWIVIFFCLIVLVALHAL